MKRKIDAISLQYLENLVKNQEKKEEKKLNNFIQKPINND